MSIVREFHIRFGQDAPATPALKPDPKLIRLRSRLIREEFQEVMAALGPLASAEDPDTVVALHRRLLEELADLRYVIDGCAVALGLPIDEAFEEVHRSNMTKTGPTDGDGKTLKGDGYLPPDMGQFVPSYVDDFHPELW